MASELSRYDLESLYSKPMEFSLYFDPRATVQEEPPNGVFKEQALGPIMVNLHPFDVGGGGFK